MRGAEAKSRFEEQPNVLLVLWSLHLVKRLHHATLLTKGGHSLMDEVGGASESGLHASKSAWSRLTRIASTASTANVVAAEFGISMAPKYADV